MLPRAPFDARDDSIEVHGKGECFNLEYVSRQSLYLLLIACLPRIEP